MRILSNIPNTDPVDADYPKGRIRNKDTVADPPEDGTPVIEEVYGDMIQFWQSLVNDASISENSLPDNTTNGYQLKDALEYFIRTLAASETQKGVVEKATATEAQNATADKYIDAANLRNALATESSPGVQEIATTAEAQALTANDKTITPAKLADVNGGILSKKNDIGDWNMLNDAEKYITHGIGDWTKILNVTAYIFADDDSVIYPYSTNLLTIDSPAQPGLVSVSGSIRYDDTNIILSRLTGGAFDTTIFDKISYNRGYIVIQYLP